MKVNIPSRGDLSQAGLTVGVEDLVLDVPPVILQTVRIPDSLRQAINATASRQNGSFFATQSRDVIASQAAETNIAVGLFDRGLWRIQINATINSDVTKVKTLAETAQLLLFDGSTAVVLAVLPFIAHVPQTIQLQLLLLFRTDLFEVQISIPGTGAGETFSMNAQVSAERLL